MGEGRKSKSYAVYNRAIIKRLCEKFGFTPHFIYASLRGDRTSASALEICRVYREMEAEVNKTLRKL